MEEEKQPSLPIKTKIAAWIMILIGTVGAGFVITISEIPSKPYSRPISFWIGLFIPFILFFLLPGVFLLKRKKWAWFLAICSSFVFSLLGVVYYLLIFL